MKERKKHFGFFFTMLYRVFNEANAEWVPTWVLFLSSIFDAKYKYKSGEKLVILDRSFEIMEADGILALHFWSFRTFFIFREIEVESFRT